MRLSALGQTREEEDERNRNRSVFDGESAAERSKRAAQVEERLKALVTPDKVLGYYNVPRAAVVTRPGATLGVAAFAGDATRLRATIWKYAEYFNVSVGAVRAVQQTDAIAAEAKRLERLAAESEASEATTGDVVWDGFRRRRARKPRGAERLRGAGATRRGERLRGRRCVSFPRRLFLRRKRRFEYRDGGALFKSRLYRKSRGRVVLARRRRRRRAARRVGAKEKRFVSERKKAPSKTEKMEAAAQSAVASAVSGAVDAAVDAADKFAEGVGLAVEKGDRRVTESERAAREPRRRTPSRARARIRGTRRMGRTVYRYPRRTATCGWRSAATPRWRLSPPRMSRMSRMSRRRWIQAS